MKLLSTTAALILMAAPALAHHCPIDMAAIDAALAEGVTLSDAEMAQVAEWRAEGEVLHNSGDHTGAVNTLAKAKEVLGID